MSIHLQTSPSHYELPINISRIYSAGFLSADTLLIATDLGVYFLGVDKGLFYGIPIKGIYDVEVVDVIDGIRLLGVGESFGKASILIFNQPELITFIKYLVNSTLYDAVVINNTVIGVGYVQVNSSYSMLLTVRNLSSLENYVAFCQSACYGRKLTVTNDGMIYLFGSYYVRGQTYQWSYDVFFSVLRDNLLSGRLLSLDGNDYVINAFLTNASIYLIINSELAGLHVIVINQDDLNASPYRVLVSGDKVLGTGATHHKDLLLIGARDRTQKNMYVILINTTSLDINSYYLGSNSLDMLVVDEWILILNNSPIYGNSILSMFSFKDFLTHLKRFNSISSTLTVVNTYITDFESLLTKHSIGYDEGAISVSLSRINVTATRNLYDVTGTSSTANYVDKPLYVFKDAELKWGKIALLVFGSIFLLLSIMLKFLMRARS